MKVWNRFAFIGVMSAAMAPFLASSAGEESKPIVDIRFDAPYRQIESSMGDEWAPTWGQDDVLYTGNDDGTGFGGVALNTMTFGKLTGNDPYKLKATTVSGLWEFHEALAGPDGAMWKTQDSLKVGSDLYRLTDCSETHPGSCLSLSKDRGKTWDSGKPVLDPKLVKPTLIAFAARYEPLFSPKIGDYVYAAFHKGIVEDEDQYGLARIATAKLPERNPADWHYRDKLGAWVSNPNDADAFANNTTVGADKANWKTTNSYSVDGTLYMFITRCHYPRDSGDPRGRHIWQDASVIASVDGGRAWTRASEQNKTKPMFPGQRFGSPYFVWYGKDGAATVDNADQYVYAVSNDGFFEAGDNYVLGRVPKQKLHNLDAADWSFYKSSTPGRFGGKAMTYYGRWNYKFAEAARRGALGALIVHEDGPASYGWATVCNSSPSTQFDIERADAREFHTPIRGWLRRDVAERLFEQVKLNFNAVKERACRADFAPVELEGAKLSVQLKLRVTPALTHNVIGQLVGAQRPEESLIYSAHWDHLGIGEPDHTGDHIYHGAVDNATAIAGLFELARVFASEPSTSRSIYFIAFAAEEKGLLGSEYYVQHPIADLEKTPAVFNMELMGMVAPAHDIMMWGNARSTLEDVLSAAAAVKGRRLSLDSQLEAGYLYRSDHFPFAKKGVPAITVTSGQDLYEGGVECGRVAYRDYIAHRYHQPADRWSHDMDLRGLALDLEVLYRAGRAIAESTSWPSWHEKSEFRLVRERSSRVRTEAVL